MLWIRKDLNATSLSLITNLDEVNVSKIRSEKCYACDFESRRACYLPSSSFPACGASLIMAREQYTLIFCEKVGNINPDERNHLLLYSGA